MLKKDINSQSLTFAMIKPEAVKQRNTGKIIDMIENNGFEVVRMVKVLIPEEMVQEFYAVHKEKPFFNELVEGIAAKPVIIMALYKDDAVAEWRKLIGATNPKDAAPGTIRHQFGTSIQDNAVHGSDSEKNSMFELSLFFPEMFLSPEDDEDCDDEDDDCESDGCCG